LSLQNQRGRSVPASGTKQALRILFSVRAPSNVRQYEGVLRALAARGHEIHLVKEPFGAKWPPFVLSLAESCPGIQLRRMPAIKQNEWWELATLFRRARFYLRFFGPAYLTTPALLSRTRKRAPSWTVTVAEHSGPAGRWLLARLLDLLEYATRTSSHLHDYLREANPDVVVATPLLVLKTAQIDLVRAAIELGVRTVYAVASWDHLSSKGALTLAPQRVLVWNDVQRQEAITLHGVDPERITVTGAQVFDEWFDRQPSRTRDAFCTKVGLRTDRPFLLYVCSSLLEASPEEPRFILRWVRHLRESGHPMLRECGFLVRRHPERTEGWDQIDVSDLENVVCWPPVGASPVDARSKADYFDSLYHAAAVIGLNTSAMIEAAIVNRPVHTVLLPEFRDNQEGTIHFHYLLAGPDALLRAARSLDDHARDLAEVLNGCHPDPDRSVRFVRAFVRPGGLEVPSTTRVVEALEAVGSQPAPAPVPAPLATRLLTPLVRLLLQPFATSIAEEIRRTQEALRLESEQRMADHRLSKQPQILEHRLRRMEAHRQGKKEATRPPHPATDSSDAP
jgi:hypothetical protein